ncbi:glucuronate isomerase [Pedobacter sp. UC225_65]|uniref:glucuronate isomerase n=1 Tax=Pedobacter sp. UC225_65 TaxID=3350173 RepID=UPI0036702696
MKEFLDENFLLQTKTAQMLYHEFAAQMPIIDYHNHLMPEQIAEDKNFENITQVWLYGDHYKWRAMRANGVDEYYITGGASDFEKFEKWAETVPYTLRNPLYHWTHLELQRYFGIREVLSGANAKKIYDECNAKLQTKEYSVQGLLRKMNVKTLCTTDHLLDNLEYHQQLKSSGTVLKVLPAFRPDKAMNSDDVVGLNQYIDKLSSLMGIAISTYDAYLSALKSRHDYFAKNGASVSDHGLEQIYAEDYTEEEVRNIFLKIRAKEAITLVENLKFKSAMLFNFALWDHQKGWVQQFHLGALRNNNNRLLSTLGPDTGFDSIGDFVQGKQLAKFLNRLDSGNTLAKTILYNLNPADNELMATMIGNYNDGTIAGKVQWGSAWWFLRSKRRYDQTVEYLVEHGLVEPFCRNVD